MGERIPVSFSLSAPPPPPSPFSPLTKTGMHNVCVCVGGGGGLRGGWLCNLANNLQLIKFSFVVCLLYFTRFAIKCYRVSNWQGEEHPQGSAQTPSTGLRHPSSNNNTAIVNCAMGLEKLSAKGQFLISVQMAVCL